MTLMEDEIVVVAVDEGIAQIVINRPNYLNALNADVLQTLILQFEKLAQDKQVRCAIITGAGEKAFVAGADIAMMQQLGPRPIADYVELGQRAMRVIETASFPVIAAVNGFALGGGLELALACDIIYCATKAKFGAPEVNLGIIPGFGGTQRLRLRCGSGAARRLVLTGDMIDPEEALRIGLVDRIAQEGKLQEEVYALAKSISSKGPLAVSAAKRLMIGSQELDLLGGLQKEVESFLKVFSSNDREEGMQAFLQKRKPQFSGK
ncbi:MAG: enoyl-CoA hydratase/isomerase family protein [Bdellovibrionales bacterium]|nr:enoyl-CoA hydratase/isomerase family protein [Bdellovibrionales bacterium]